MVDEQDLVFTDFAVLSETRKQFSQRLTIVVMVQPCTLEVLLSEASNHEENMPPPARGLGKGQSTCLVQWQEQSVRLLNGDKWRMRFVKVRRNIGAIVENSPDLVTIVQDNVLKYVNKTFCEKLGYTLDEITSPSFNFVDKLVPARFRDLVLKAYQERLQGKTVAPYDISLKTRGGLEFPVTVKGRRIFYRGKPADIVILIDISEHKQMLEETQRLAKFPSENPSPVLRLSLDGKVLDANKSSEPVLQTWKCKVGEKAPKSWIDLANEAYSNQSTKSIDIQVSDRFFLLTLVPIKDAGYVNVYGRDITDRVVVEQALRDSEERYRTLFEDSPVSLWEEDYSEVKKFVDSLRMSRVKDFRVYFESHPEDVVSCVDKRVIDVNKATLVLHEASSKDAIKSNLKAVFCKETYDELREELIAIAEGRTRFQKEIVTQTMTGKKITVDFRWKIVSGYDKTYSKLLMSMVDITERKRMEEELENYTKHLEELVEARTKEVQQLNANITQRLVQKTSQIENVSIIRDRLRKSPDISTGMDLILEGALKDLAMDAAAVLVFNRKEDIADIGAFKSMTKEITLNPNYPPCRLSECEVLALDKPVSKTEGMSCILGTNSIYCAPIHLGKEVYGALLLGSQKTPTLDDSDLAVLRMYAELASTVFETQRLTIMPVKEESIVRERRFELEFGGVYLAKNEVERAFNVFADGVLSGLEGLCVTRTFPPTVRRKHGLEKTPIVWLTQESVEGQITVNSLQDLSILIGNFLEKTKRSIVLLDGIEYLITNHGFESFLRFLQLNRSRIEQKEAILVIPMLEEAIDAKDARLIERETIALMAN